MKLHEPFVSIYHEDGSDSLNFQVLFPTNKDKPVYGKQMTGKEAKDLHPEFVGNQISDTDIVVAYTFDKALLDDLGLQWPPLKMDYIGFRWLSRTRFSKITGNISRHHKKADPITGKIFVKQIKGKAKGILNHDGTFHWPGES